MIIKYFFLLLYKIFFYYYKKSIYKLNTFIKYKILIKIFIFKILQKFFLKCYKNLD